MAARESAAGVTKVADVATDLDALTARLQDSIRQFRISKEGSDSGRLTCPGKTAPPVDNGANTEQNGKAELSMA